jgi:hypothetical protein
MIRPRDGGVSVRATQFRAYCRLARNCGLFNENGKAEQ